MILKVKICAINNCSTTITANTDLLILKNQSNTINNNNSDNITYGKQEVAGEISITLSILPNHIKVNRSNFFNRNPKFGGGSDSRRLKVVRWHSKEKGGGSKLQQLTS